MRHYFSFERKTLNPAKCDATIWHYFLSSNDNLHLVVLDDFFVIKSHFLYSCQHPILSGFSTLFNLTWKYDIFPRVLNFNILNFHTIVYPSNSFQMSFFQLTAYYYFTLIYIALYVLFTWNFKVKIENNIPNG